MITTKINTIQAFKAMTCFLEDYYKKTLSDDIGSLLGDMQLCKNGSTWDPAAWDDWVIALENKNSITPMEAFKGMFNFLQAYYQRTSCSSNDLEIILHAIQEEKSEQFLSSDVWRIWMNCVKKNT